MKRNMIVILVSCLCIGFAGVGFAAEKKAEKAEKNTKSTTREGAGSTSKGEKAKLVGEGELAQWLVRVLGLARFLPAAPTDLECFQILMQNNIQPAGGWKQDSTVTMGTLARVVVQGLGRQSEVANPAEDASWISFLKEIDVDFGTIGAAMENLDPLPQPVGPEAVITSTDPLGKLQRINPPDNQQLGVDLSAMGRIFTQVTLPNRPPPLTPN